MSLWENVWEQVRKEMPEGPARPKTWGGFIGALFAAVALYDKLGTREQVLHFDLRIDAPA